MEDYQARGYIFESIVWSLLKKYGYIDVNTSELRGRGASHQIDAYGILSIPTAFMYPVRLICECKCFGDTYPVQLQHMRSFLGVIKDISENYTIDENGNRSTPYRYTDVGCFFSASSFTIDAQEYAWAHNLFVISFGNTPLLKPIINDIKNFVDSIRHELKRMTKRELIDRYWTLRASTEINRTSLAIGIVDGIYPVALVGRNNWLENINEYIDRRTERVYAEKTKRKAKGYETIFFLIIGEEEVHFSLPDTIAKKIVERIDKSEYGEKIFEIDIPYLKKIDNLQENIELKRFVKIVVVLPYHEKEEYIASLLVENPD